MVLAGADFFFGRTSSAGLRWKSLRPNLWLRSPSTDLRRSRDGRQDRQHVWDDRGWWRRCGGAMFDAPQPSGLIIGDGRGYLRVRTRTASFCMTGIGTSWDAGGTWAPTRGLSGVEPSGLVSGFAHEGTPMVSAIAEPDCRLPTVHSLWTRITEC